MNTQEEQIWSSIFFHQPRDKISFDQYTSIVKFLWHLNFQTLNVEELNGLLKFLAQSNLHNKDYKLNQYAVLKGI